MLVNINMLALFDICLYSAPIFLLHVFAACAIHGFKSNNCTRVVLGYVTSHASLGGQKSENVWKIDFE